MIPIEQRLTEDFGAGSAVAGLGVRALREAVLADRQPIVRASFSAWKTFFARAHGRDPDRHSAKLAKLAACYGIAVDEDDPAAVLFALHTYYAVLVKLFVGRVMEAQAACGFAPLKVTDFPGGDPFSWYTAAWSEPIAAWVRQVAARLCAYDGAYNTAGGDLFGRLYQELFPRALRHALGEYYTPDWLAAHVLDEVGYRGDDNRRLLDPACGSGTFLVAAIRRIRSRHEARGETDPAAAGRLVRKILAGVVGFDLNPLAVIAARANYLLAVSDLLGGLCGNGLCGDGHCGDEQEVAIPVHFRDSILEDAGPGETFDYVVGNPPWIAWDNLPEDYRRATRPLWERYGLFSLSGAEARHGGGKKDLSMLMTYAAADRYLECGGRLGFVITQTLFQTKGAGDGFRRFRLGEDGPWLKVLRADDMVRFRPFGDAANWTGVIVLEKGGPTVYPVPYVKWRLDGELPRGTDDWRRHFHHRTYRARPIDPDRPSSPWFLLPEGLDVDLARLTGPSEYRAHLGANTGGANGVYWVELLGRSGDGTGDGIIVRNLVERGKRGAVAVRAVVEPELLYPLLRWSDVSRYHAEAHAHILMVQDVHTRRGIDEPVMRERYPKTYAYLERFRRVLVARAAYKRYQHRAPFYSMYNVGAYTVAPIKVVWRRMDRRINAAVVGRLDDPLLGARPVIAQETCVEIAADSADEAHYLCAVLNSSMVAFLVGAHSVYGGKGFGTPGMLDFLHIRRFDSGDPRHVELGVASRAAHEATSRSENVTEIQRRIDRLAAELWGLDNAELAAIDREVSNL